jgi:D-amino peptidase
VSRYAAVCRPPKVTAAAIAAAAARAGKLAGRRPPARPGVPGEGGAAATVGFTVEIEVDATQLAQAAAIVPTVRRIADRTVSYHSPTAWDMIRCFKTVTTMIAAATEDSYG